MVPILWDDMGRFGEQKSTEFKTAPKNTILPIFDVLSIKILLSDVALNPKRAGAESAPLNIFCYISAGCYFFALKLHDFFSSSLALDLRPFLETSDLGL